MRARPTAFLSGKISAAPCVGVYDVRKLVQHNIVKFSLGQHGGLKHAQIYICGICVFGHADAVGPAVKFQVAR